MARDGLFFRKLGEVHPRFGTPALSIVVGHARGRWCSPSSGTFEQLLTYVVFVGWIFYGLGAACVFVLRRTEAGRAASVSRARLPVDAAALHRRRGRARRQHDRHAAGSRRGRHRRRPARCPGVFHLAANERIGAR